MQTGDYRRVSTLLYFPFEVPIRNPVLITSLSPVTARPTTRKTYLPELRFGYVMFNEEPKE